MSKLLTSHIYSASDLDSDTQAFLTATGITDAKQIYALNTLVKDLKGFSLWTKTTALYPMIGGTATTHKYNLKDPRDLDAAYRLVFSGGWTHSATGALPNGTTGYANTFLIPSTALSLNDTHLLYYSRTDSAAAASVEIGSQAVGAPYTLLCVRYLGNLIYSDLNQSGDSSTGNTVSSGLFIGSRTASNVNMISKNGNVLATTSNGSTSRSSLSLYIGANNINGTAGNFSGRECAIASAGNGLTSIDISNYYTCVQKYQMLLGRAV